ncbi:hypothetical protein [uncultured Leptotrichia sp.]|jgi:tRNA(Ile2) C34 agmatinyltransferase TiaS|uniref:OB-fold protein n=1 Tax=uncultured Leptotrichia sp. TaxID=159271 RepID=UPI0026393895|nr:hypothetical protein [uncultured Leptotrichia sp.]
MAKKIIGEDGKTYIEKKPFYKKWWFILLVVLVVLGAISNKKEGTTKTESNQTQSSVTKEETKKEVVYEKITAKKLLDDLKNNALKAEQTHNKKEYEITGEISVIDAQGKYISINPIGDDFVLTGIQAYVKNDEQKKVVAELSKGDKITVKGKIKDVGEVMGYTVDIDEISKTAK